MRYKHRMSRLRPYSAAVLAGVIALLSSCTGLRKLPEGEYLYTGSEIIIEKEDDFRDRRNVERELNRVMRPQPNSTFLFSRPALWMYQAAGEPRGRGLRYWMRERLGEEPVLFDPAITQRNQRLINNRLYNMGYFDAAATHTADTAGKTISVRYRISLRTPYVFGELHSLEDTTGISGHMNRELERSTITTGEPYSLDVLKRERQRIDRELKQTGYFFFHPDNILFRADSTAGNRRVDIYPVIKPEVPANALRQYRTGNIYVHADYNVRGSAGMPVSDTLSLGDGFYFTDRLSNFRPEIIKDAVFFKRDSLYNINDHDLTLNQLMSLGTFQFVNIRFLNRPEINDVLDVRVLLTPLERRSLSAELRGVTKSNNFAGPGFSTSITNHNMFGGAESFNLSLNAAYEVLIGQQYSASSREIGIDAGLSVPRFLLPSRMTAKHQPLSPKTNISVGTNFLSRTDAFRLASMHANFGYAWNGDKARQHRLSPLVFNLYVLGEVSGEMEDILDKGTLLRKGLFEQFIIGGNYSYIYNSRLMAPGDNDWYFQFNLDMSGNIAYLLMNAIPGVTRIEDGGYGLFNQSFAQYSRADIDLRYYRQLGEGSRLASRIFMGAGIPYANSDMMPYVKQYVIGGSNSVRAFHPRSLGPGSYLPEEGTGGTYSIRQTGDLKLEANLEYRFDITGLFKGAVFMDAGNIWRLRDDEDVPGGKFDRSSFYKEIAIGAGTGLRIDAGFFILRFDFALPLANPSLTGRPFFGPVRLADSQWRRENIVFNLGIGYPF